MRVIIRPNQPLIHAQGFVLNVLIYISTTFENGARRVQRNARNWNRGTGMQTKADFYRYKNPDFYRYKNPDFYPLVAEHVATN